MSQQTVTTCDICPKVKGETNHWWTLIIRGSLFMLAPTTYFVRELPVQTFGEVKSLIAGDKNADLCSEACVKSYLHKYMEEANPQGKQV